MFSADYPNSAWLAGGEMGALMRAKNWTASPLGCPETWPQGVKTAVSICLNSRFPRPLIGPMLDEVRRRTSVEDLQISMGQLPLEESYFSHSYSPILSSDGYTIDGVFCACIETTEKVVRQRRLTTSRDLRTRAAGQRTAEVSCLGAAEEASPGLPSGEESDVSEALTDKPCFLESDVPGVKSRVLVVDDNRDMRDQLCHLLSKRWDVDAIRDGLAVLDKVKQHPPDLILADIMMPGFDGNGLLTALRADLDLAEIPVILLAARAGEEACIEGLSAGADDYLIKPFSDRELIARVQSHLALSRLRSRYAASTSQLHKLSIRLTGVSDLKLVLDEVLDATMQLQGAHFGDVQLYDEAAGILKIVAHRGVDQRFLDYFATVDASGTCACGLALRDGSRIIVEDVITHPDYALHREIAARTGFRSVQSTPLLNHHTGKPVGMLSTMFREPHRPTERELRLTDLYARQAADVITSRLAELALRKSEARLQAAVDLVKLGLYSWNPQTNELEWDDKLRAMWGVSAGEPINYDTWLACLHPDDVARVKDAIQRCVDPERDGVYDIEYRVIGKNDGVERWIATRGRTNFENGVPASFYGAALDVTNRKRIEKTLECRVEARTRALEEANRQLRAQIEQREIAEAEVQQLQRLDAIGQITSGLAHDFNNLLSVILINARLLATNVRDPFDQESVELIRAAAERGASLTTQLLAFSRKQRLEPQAVNLNHKIAGMRDLLSASLSSSVQLQTALAADLRPALADPTQLELMILNLVLNARDAMPSGGVLTLETFNTVINKAPSRPEEPAPGQYVVLAVRDTGTGIPDNVLPRVFEPFFSTKEAGKGSGLGLAQVFGFVKQSDGGVAIETRQGEGTTVKIFLPRAEADPRERERGSSDTGGGPAANDKKRILVVDDDKAVLISTLRLLDTLGYSAIPAQSGREALQRIVNEPEIDLVLADIAMPEMSGVELARTINEKYPALPVILVTGLGDSEVFKDCPKTGILKKPIGGRELIEKIAVALNHEI